MKHTKFDQEYYILDTESRNEYPTLEWGETDYSLFRQDQPILKLNSPLEIVFDEPYPHQYVMPDLLLLGSKFASSGNIKQLFDRHEIYGIEFFPIEKITDNKGKKITGYYATHIWNKLPAIDKNNYVGGKPNRKGYIFDLVKFSLDEKFLKTIPLENRLIFELKDSPATYLIHESIYQIIQSENLTGFSFFRVDEWDDNAMFL